MGKFFLWLQERVKLWIKPANPVLIIVILSDLTRSRTDLVVENVLLRQQLIVLNRQIKRPQLTNPDRFRIVLLSHFTKFWKQALHIIQFLARAVVLASQNQSCYSICKVDLFPAIRRLLVCRKIG
jgi:hypothetical protein